VERNALPDEARARSGEDVTHSAAGHSGVSGGIQLKRMTRRCNRGSAPFVKQRDAPLVGKIPGQLISISALVGESRKLARVRGEESVGRESLRTDAGAGESIQGIGIHDHRLFMMKKRLNHRAVAVPAESRADRHNIVLKFESLPD
jgi:hypothetical protein